MAENIKQENKQTKNQEQLGESNRTDPKVCHDPSFTFEGIARLFPNQNKELGEDGEISAYNEYDMTKIDGIEYPLVTINNRNIENHEIVNMNISYNDFLPTISITIFDEHEEEQKINTTQMSSIIRVVMVSPVDKVYKKILLNFRILNASIDPSNTKRISYYGEYYVEGFRNVNTMLISMKSPCSICNGGGHVNANTWEMLHRISELTGLGFATTKKCKEVEDRLIRNINTKRFNSYIKEQLLHSGTDVDNIFDAWVDLYGYIVMVNIPWILNEEITYKELSIIANTGTHPTSNNLPEQIPEEVPRTLTNYNLMGVISNLEIESYYMKVNNESIEHGTLERIYQISLVDNGRNTKLDLLDIQTKQNSIDGEHIEDYNTGKTRPIPQFNFNDPAWTGLSGGYDVNTQKKIRSAYLKKIHQSLLYVKLKTINFGLQRGTLVNIVIFEDDYHNKDFMLKNTSRLERTDTDMQEDELNLAEILNIDKYELMMNNGIMLPNYKLSGLYYIDGMYFEYNPNVGKIDQTIILIKKGTTSGYTNKHNGLGLPLSKYESQNNNEN